jgi:hypothetical protein
VETALLLENEEAIANLGFNPKQHDHHSRTQLDSIAVDDEAVEVIFVDEFESRLCLYGCPFAPLGTCEVIPFRTNSRIRFDTAFAPVAAKPLKTTNEAPRSEAG